MPMSLLCQSLKLRPLSDCFCTFASLSILLLAFSGASAYIRTAPRLPYIVPHSVVDMEHRTFVGDNPVRLIHFE